MEGQNALTVAELIAAAVRHLAEGDDAAMLAALGAAAARDPGDRQLHFMTALASWQMGDAAKALALAKSCFERDPGNGTAAEMVASLYAQVGELVESLYYGKLAIALAPDPVMHDWLPPRFPKFDEAFLSIREKPLLAQARLLLATGKLEAALELARQHVEVVPSDAAGRQFFAETLLRAGRAAAAVEALQPLARTTVAAPLASLYASALAAVGEAEAKEWHERAVAGAPEDAAIAARRIIDAAALGIGQRQRDHWIKDWLKRFTAPAKPRRWRAAGDKLVIGYLVSHLADRRDVFAVAAVARAHARSGATIIGYGLGAQSWDENAPLRGAFDKWRDIADIDAATLAKTFASDGLDVAIDAGGLRAPAVLRALARVDGAVRVAWIAEARALEGRIYDAAIAPRSARSGGEFALWQPPAGAYPLLRDWTRALQSGRGGAGFCFGSDVRLSQLGPETMALWRAVLAATPQASLLLRANDMGRGANIGRLIARFGAELARRVDVVAAAEPEAFWYQVDLALAPAVADAPRLAAEAIACGVPVLALEGAGADAALLGDLGLRAMVAASARAYAAAAAELAGAPDKRREAAAATEVVAARGEAVAAEIAQTIETAARALLAKAAA